NTKIPTAPLSVSHDRQSGGNGAVETDRGGEERHDQRGLLPRPFSREAGNAGRADTGVDGTGRWVVAAFGDPRPRPQIAVFGLDDGREVPPARGARRSIADRGGRPDVEGRSVQDQGQGVRRWQPDDGSDDVVRDGRPRRTNEILNMGEV